jgi:transcription termination/antitermination protein NusG
LTDETNKLAEELAEDVATNGAAAADSAPHAGSDLPEGNDLSEGYSEDTDIRMSSVEEPIADEAAAYEEAEEVIDEEQAESADGGEGEVAEDDVADEPEIETNKGPVYMAPPEDDDIRMDWYILKVQSNRERSIAEALERKFAIEGLDKYCDQIIVPTEKVTEFKGGKKKIVERKLYPGYIVVHMHINDDTWFAVRETSGVGDFTGAGGKPTPMLQSEVSRIVQTEAEETTEAPKLDIKFTTGDKVKVKEGNFESFEGEVGTIDEASGRVTVMINIFGRSTPVELEYWQIEAM